MFEKRINLVGIVTVGVLMCACPVQIQAQMDTFFTFQGQLLDDGAPLTDTVSMRFNLWNAVAGGSQLGSTYTAMNVDVVEGLFTVQIDSSYFGSSGFNGDPRWLQVLVYDTSGGSWVTLSPRQAVTPAPYALYAAESGGGGGTCLWSENGNKIYYNTDNVGIGTSDPNTPLHVTTATDSVTVMASNTAPSLGTGVWAQTAATSGTGVFGQSMATSGYNAGVHGVNWSTGGRGVFGYNGTSTGDSIGVLGRTNSTSGYAVRGEAFRTSGVNYGVYGETDSASGYGVYGAAPTGGKGVTGYSGNDNYGYLGYNLGGVYGCSSDGYGVRGYSVNDWGVYGSVPNGSTQAGIVGAIILSSGAVQWVPESGVCGSSEDGYGVSGRVDGGKAVYGTHDDTGNFGYLATPTEGAYGETHNTNSYGVHGKATSNSSTTNGVYGEATGSTYGFGVRGSVSNTTGAGVYGYNGGSGIAGDFYSSSGTAGRFQNHYGDGVYINHNAHYNNTAGLSVYSTGTEEPIGIEVSMDADFGRLATFDLNGSTGYIGSAFRITADNSGNVVEVIGEDTTSNYDVMRVQSDGYGSAILGYNSRNSSDTPAVYGYHVSSVSYYGVGVKGEGGYKGVEGRAIGGDGTGTKYGVYGYATNGATNYAGYFSGNLRCTGTLQKGSGTFMIDHPLDPENKYLYHSFVESPDMMNIYNGNVMLDSNGEAIVTMPEWFEALNMEFRYQLTCIGGFAQVYIDEEIAGNQFKIAGGKAGLKVSWQVTGIRQDPFANANRVQVEVDKPEDEVGTYLHPEAWGVDPELQLDRVREATHQEQAQETPIE